MIIHMYFYFQEKHLFEAFIIPDASLKKVKELLNAEIDLRLDPNADLDDPLTFYPSFVEDVPDGSGNIPDISYCKCEK